MGNKIVIFTEEQFEDYQVSDTHINIPAPGFKHLYLRNPTSKPCGHYGLCQIHTNYFVSVGFHTSGYLDCDFLVYETMQLGMCCVELICFVLQNRSEDTSSMFYCHVIVIKL